MKNKNYVEYCLTKLNESIEKGQDYSIIYEISVELDELIARFYREKLKVI